MTLSRTARHSIGKSLYVLFCFIAVSLIVCGCGTNNKSDTDSGSNLKEAAVEKTKVVYAAKNIEEGEIIPAEALEERDVEVAKAPIDAFNSVNAVVGQQAAYMIPAGQILSQHAVKQMSIDTGFEGKIPENMRAITFAVDVYADVAGFISPESHVDIFTIADNKTSKQVTPLLSDVQVLAVGTTYQKAPGATCANPAGSITVAVNAVDSEKLIKSLANSRPFLALRPDKPQEETEESPEEQATSDDSKQDK